MAWDSTDIATRSEQHGFDLIGQMVRARRHQSSVGASATSRCSPASTRRSSRGIENGKQFGLRWSRFADLVDALDGLEGVSSPPDLVAKAPFGVSRADADRVDSVPPIPTIDLTGDLDGWEERHHGRFDELGDEGYGMTTSKTTGMTRTTDVEQDR